MYSTSQVDVDMVTCLFELQEMAPLPKEKMKPEVDRCVSRQPAKVCIGPAYQSDGVGSPKDQHGVACA